MMMLRAPEVARKVGSSEPTVWRRAKDDPQFPKPVKISERVTAWVEDEVDAYLAGRVAASRREAQPVIAA